MNKLTIGGRTLGLLNASESDVSSNTIDPDKISEVAS